MRTRIVTAVVLAAFIVVAGLSVASAAPAPVTSPARLILVPGSPSAFCETVTDIPLAECEALVAIYNSTDGPNWVDHTGWLVSNTPCDMTMGWHRVTCIGGHVTRLSLSENDLSGPLPPEIGNLTQLQELSAWVSKLSGPIPPQIGSLTNLESLVLSAGQLSGPIPPEIANLGKLQTLVLESNKLDGTIPPAIYNLPALRELDLSNNQFVGAIPAQIANLTKLEQFNLGGNQLTGGIPIEVTTIGTLVSLRLNGNPLGGSIPPEIGNLTGLRFLDLSSNQLQGSIPTQIGNLKALENLWISSNQLSGSIPSELGSLSALKTLWLFDNQLSGSLPAEIGDLVSLEWLLMESNQLTGEFPASITNLADLTMLTFDCTLTSSAADVLAFLQAKATFSWERCFNAGSISGHVYKADGVTVISGEQISVHASGASEGTTGNGTFVSQADGSYTIGGLAPGKYRVEANNNRVPGSAFVTKLYNDKFDWDSADLIDVVAGQTTPNVNFALGPGGGISGHVYAEDGTTPIAGACVNVTSSTQEWNQLASWGETGLDGAFSFSGIPVGSVYVRAYARCGGPSPTT